MQGLRSATYSCHPCVISKTVHSSKVVQKADGPKFRLVRSSYTTVALQYGIPTPQRIKSGWGSIRKQMALHGDSTYFFISKHATLLRLHYF